MGDILHTTQKKLHEAQLSIDVINQVLVLKHSCVIVREECDYILLEAVNFVLSKTTSHSRDSVSFVKITHKQRANHIRMIITKILTLIF